MQNWYVVATKNGQEDTATDNLLSQGFEIFAPTIEIQRLSRGELKSFREPAFFGYVFCLFDPTIQSASTINNTFGVRRLVTFGDRLATLNHDLMARLQSRFKTAEPVMNQPSCLKGGSHVRIKTGPFQNIDAIFVEPDGAKRSIIMMSLLGSNTRVTVDNSDLVTV